MHPTPCGGLVGRKPKVKIPLARAQFSSSYLRWYKPFGFIPTEARRRKSPESLIPGTFGFVTSLGFEPKTHSLEGCCSIQLSYEANLLLLCKRVQN